MVANRFICSNGDGIHGDEIGAGGGAGFIGGAGGTGGDFIGDEIGSGGGGGFDGGGEANAFGGNVIDVAGGVNGRGLTMRTLVQMVFCAVFRPMGGSG